MTSSAKKHECYTFHDAPPVANVSEGHPIVIGAGRPDMLWIVEYVVQVYGIIRKVHCQYNKENDVFPVHPVSCIKTVNTIFRTNLLCNIGCTGITFCLFFILPVITDKQGGVINEISVTVLRLSARIFRSGRPEPRQPAISSRHRSRYRHEHGKLER